MMRQFLVNLIADAIVEAHRRMDAERLAQMSVHVSDVVGARISPHGTGQRGRGARY
jgi:hypothetical protein